MRCESVACHGFDFIVVYNNCPNKVPVVKTTKHNTAGGKSGCQLGSGEVFIKLVREEKINDGQ